MTLADLTPDVALAALLDKQVEVQTSATTSVAVRCYSDGKMPNKGLADEFLTVMWNGSISSKVEHGDGLYEGNLLLTIYCKTQTDNTVKTQRVNQMIRQCDLKVNGPDHRGINLNGVHYELNSLSPITPTTTNLTTGYSATVLNVEWHTT